jgi:hypothetical protein
VFPSLRAISTVLYTCIACESSYAFFPKELAYLQERARAPLESRNPAAGFRFRPDCQIPAADERYQSYVAREMGESLSRSNTPPARKPAPILMKRKSMSTPFLSRNPSRASLSIPSKSSRFFASAIPSLACPIIYWIGRDARVCVAEQCAASRLAICAQGVQGAHAGL